MIALFIILYIITYWFIQRKSISGRFSLTSTNIFIYIYVLYCVIPSLILIANPEAAYRIENNDNIYYIAFVVFIGYFFFIIGGLFGTNLIVKNKKHTLKQALYAYRHRRVVNDIQGWFLFMLFIVSIVSLFVSIYFFASNLNLFYDIFTSDQVGGKRTELRAGSGLYVIQFVYILPWISMLFYFSSKIYKRRFLFYYSIFLLIFSVLSQVAILYRGNVVITIVLFFFFANSFNFKFLKRGLVAVLLIFSFIFIATSLRVTDGQTVSSKLFSRMVTPLTQLEYVIDQYPRDEWVNGGTVLLDILALGPGYDVNFNGSVYTEMGNYGSGTATVTILGEGYANLNIIGVIIEMLFLGFILQFLHYKLIYGNKTILAIGLYTVISVLMAKSVIAGVVPTMVAPSVVLSFFVIIYYFSRLIGYNKYRY